MEIFTKAHSPHAGREVTITLEDALASWVAERLRALQEAFPGSEWVEGSDEDYSGSEATQAVA